MEDKRHYDVNKAWENVNSAATRKQHRRIAVKVGSTTLVAVLAVLILIPLFRTNPVSEMTAQEQYTGRKKATLYLADGPTVELMDSLDHSLDQIVIPENITPLNNTAKNSVKKNVLEVPTGGEYYFELPDGTKVWINSQTRLEFPSEFTGKKREVFVSGQAYFDVVHNAEMPFVIHTPRGDVEVKGTSFDLKVYDNDQTFETTLVEGSVSLAIPELPNTLMRPGQRSVFSEVTGEISTQNVDVKLYTSWKDGVFYFEDKNLSEIAKELERWYEVSFAFTDAEAARVRYSGQYDKNQQLDEILQLLSQTGGINFITEENTIKVKSQPSS
ncbi:FecR domain-containing protein [Maribellus sp. CM-23]|uniref:FecR family protein n=1 Tax=Maribellus sp. CM-23 TaxID=2781026 RepID=UPI001F47CE65|nr:FecR domain-containing protein [Maribellus sp. CM-23]MCE4566079.1 FecR domain-containing protein [Maribellus sp. CM-23]